MGGLVQDPLLDRAQHRNQHGVHGGLLQDEGEEYEMCILTR